MSVARLNFSHGTQESHRKMYNLLRNASKEEGTELAIIQDLAGPKIRAGKFEGDKPVDLVKGSEVVLTTRPVEGHAGLIPVSYEMLPQDVKEGNDILLHDGDIHIEVLSTSDTDVTCRVITGGLLRSRQGINLPGAQISVDSVTEKDYEDLAFGLRLGVDYVALSFVRSAEDIKQVKAFIASNGFQTPVIAKIEKPEGVKNIDEILQEADAIMIARGDLGVELAIERVPLVQKQLIAKANDAGIPVITATQMLESMCSNPRPTRAEASDVANAILDGTDAVMLSGETAAGGHPVKAVRMMAKIAAATEKHLHYYRIPRGEPNEATTISEASAYAASEAAEDLRAKAIVVFTFSGATAKLVAKSRPKARILALSPSEDTCRELSLVWGTYPVLTQHGEDLEELLSRGVELLKQKELIETGNVIVCVAGTLLAQGAANLVRIMEV